MGFEPGDKGNVTTVGKEATSKDIRGEKTYNEQKNEDIYESYQKQQTDSIIKARRLQWMGHMDRVTDERTVGRIAWKTPGYKKKRRRPRKRWRGCAGGPEG